MHVGLGEPAALEPRVPHPHVVERRSPSPSPVLRPEVLVGEEQHLVAAARGADRRQARRGPLPSAQSSTARALVEVQTAPPWRPTNAFSAAEEFM